jgi:thymidylate synthase (FAD)
LKLIQPSFEIFPSDIEVSNIENMIRKIESAARLCYKTEDCCRDTIEESARWIANIALDRKHESILEHGNIGVNFVFDRGVSHELVRHRIGTAFSQESTRYCNYSKDKFDNEISVIQPFFFDPMEEGKYINVPSMKLREIDKNPELGIGTDIKIGHKMNSFDVWFLGCLWSEWSYNTLINTFEASPQEARSVLPNSLKTEIRVTMNLRSLRHMLSLRAIGTTGKPHPQIQQVMLPLLKELSNKIPVLFDDLVEEAEKRGLFNKCLN